MAKLHSVSGLAKLAAGKYAAAAARFASVSFELGSSFNDVRLKLYMFVVLC